MKQLVSLIATLFIFFVSQTQANELRLAGLFADQMVLQREQPVPVWGWANPGEAITVQFAGQSKTQTADANGKWFVTLDPMHASAEGRVLVVQSTIENRKSKITDVIVGDVWLCSGQSNMHFRMAQVENSKTEIAAANDPALRFFTVDDQFSQSPMADVSGQWSIDSPRTTVTCSAVAYYFAQDLRQKTGIPIGLIISSIGGTRIETWMTPETLATIAEVSPLVEKWSTVSPEEFEKIGITYRDFQHQRYRVHPQAVKVAKAEGTPEPPAPKMPKLRCLDCPSALHNGMTAPLQPFAIRGEIWYQGESNSSQPAAYEKLLPAMIADWRRVWGAELPFLFVQIAPHRNMHPSFREAQQRIWQKTPHTAMVVTTDVGDATNIHPIRKRPVGERLALAAYALSYKQSIDCSGPIFAGVIIDGDRAVVSFTHDGEGLMAKGATLRGFTIASEDGKFVPAKAVTKVRLSSLAPKVFRNPLLFNMDGLRYRT
jgi:sialate O-acetylesterase